MKKILLLVATLAGAQWEYQTWESESGTVFFQISQQFDDAYLTAYAYITKDSLIGGSFGLDVPSRKQGAAMVWMRFDRGEWYEDSWVSDGYGLYESTMWSSVLYYAVNARTFEMSVKYSDGEKEYVFNVSDLADEIKSRPEFSLILAQVIRDQADVQNATP